MESERSAVTGETAAPVRQRLRAALTAAMKARDRVAVAALRSALGAIDNAEATEITADTAPASQPGEGPSGLAGTVGPGTAETARRVLTEPEMQAIVRAEAAERRAAADGYERTGHRARAESLRAEAAALGAVLDSSDAAG